MTFRISWKKDAKIEQVRESEDFFKSMGYKCYTNYKFYDYDTWTTLCVRDGNK